MHPPHAPATCTHQVNGEHVGSFGEGIGKLKLLPPNNMANIVFLREKRNASALSANTV